MIMDTPICDFVNRYAESRALRLHMPGHKGIGNLGEQLDITEIDGADSLYEAGGIIRKSEENAAALFGAQTLYSTEGSSQCIRAMVYLAMLWGKQQGRRPLIAAARNAHKTFLSAAALLDVEVQWLYPRKADSYLSCLLDAEDLACALSAMAEKPAAVYLTSPDYLGNVAPVKALAQVCHRFGCLLLVDNAHGAYLRFLQPSQYPTDLGADLCCSSAHKTLPVLTGGAYLHVSPSAPALCGQQARTGMMLFGSTSPSYLILQSLDAANAYLENGYVSRLAEFAARLEKLKATLTCHGYVLCGNEPLKLTIRTKPYGYTGDELAQLLQEKNMICEFHDPDFLVLMLTPENTPREMEKLEQALVSIPRKPAIDTCPPVFCRSEAVLPIRAAALSLREVVPVAQSVGRVLAAATVGCPPAVPIVVCGERIDEAAAACLAYYGIESCEVVTDDPSQGKERSV